MLTLSGNTTQENLETPQNRDLKNASTRITSPLHELEVRNAFPSLSLTLQIHMTVRIEVNGRVQHPHSNAFHEFLLKNPQMNSYCICNAKD